MRLDLTQASVETIYVTIWASSNVSLHMGKTDNADEIRTKHFGIRLQVGFFFFLNLISTFCGSKPSILLPLCDHALLLCLQSNPIFVRDLPRSISVLGCLATYWAGPSG